MKATMGAKARGLIERLEASYNRVEHELRATIGHRRKVRFPVLIQEAVALDPRDRQLLRLASGIRNLLVHARTKPDEFPLTPSASVVAQLESLAQRLTKPTLAIPTFGKDVETLLVSDSLAKVLKRIRERDYSQFPVYEGSVFRGLLTENGITRWLARYVTKEMSLVELEDAPVKSVLTREEEPGTNWAFVSGGASVDRVRQLFADGDLLEAVLITEEGHRDEKLIGIATRWDMLKWRREHKSA